MSELQLQRVQLRFPDPRVREVQHGPDERGARRRVFVVAQLQHVLRLSRWRRELRRQAAVPVPASPLRRISLGQVRGRNRSAR